MASSCEECVSVSASSPFECGWCDMLNRSEHYESIGAQQLHACTCIATSFRCISVIVGMQNILEDLLLYCSIIFCISSALIIRHPLPTYGNMENGLQFQY